MKLDDFRFLRSGKSIRALAPNEAHLLNPINIHTKHHDHALLLLHGFTSSPAVYRLMVPALMSSYDAIVCPLLPGHGESIRAFAAATSSEWVETAEQAYQALAKDYKKIDVLGLSLGGILACHLSQSYPINHLYLLAPALKVQFNLPLALITARVLNTLGFRYLRTQGGNLHSTTECELVYKQLPVTTIIEMLSFINEFKATPASCPTDLFLGRFDTTVDTHFIEKKFKPFKNCKTHWLEHSAHVLPLDNDVNHIIDCIKKNTALFQQSHPLHNEARPENVTAPLNGDLAT